MKTRTLSLALSLALSLPAAAPAGQATAAAVVAFVDVAVVPMDRERVLEHQTVIVRDGRIVAIGPAAKTKAPAGALEVNGRGKYLMPGLAEMHGHLPHPNTDEKVARSFLVLFLANGVTTVRGMFGFPNHVALRDRVARGEILGPTLKVASPALGGQGVPTAEAADRLVREHKQAGFDLLKVHEGLSPEAFAAVAAAARREKIPFGGHVSEAVGLLRSLEAGQGTIEHLDGYLEALEADDSPIRAADAATRAAKLLDHLDERKIPALAKATRDAGAWVVPTMALWQTFFSDVSVEELRRRPELKYVPPAMVDQWAGQRANQLEQIGADAAEGRRVVALRDRILDGLADGKVGILLGSDAPQLFSVPGFSLQREMQAMVKAGLTPYQVLESGTRNVAIYLGTPSEFGTVEVGRRADLILVDADPLADVANVARRSGVMVRGRWLPKAELDRMLADIEASYAPKP